MEHIAIHKMDLPHLDPNSMTLLQIYPNPIILLLEQPSDIKEEEAFQQRWPSSVKKSSRSDIFAAFLPSAFIVSTNKKMLDQQISRLSEQFGDLSYSRYGRFRIQLQFRFTRKKLWWRFGKP